VYFGSFWNLALRCDEHHSLFELEEQNLFADIQSLARNAVLRKLVNIIKRARLAKVCCLLFFTRGNIMGQFVGHIRL